MVATRKIATARAAVAQLRRQAAEACILWQAAHLAGLPTAEVEACEVEYLRLLQQVKLWDDDPGLGREGPGPHVLPGGA